MNHQTETDIFKWIMEVPEERREKRFSQFITEFQFALYKGTVKLVSEHLSDKFLNNVDALDPEMAVYRAIDGTDMLQDLQDQDRWNRESFRR